jgi:hypothetical protein
MPATSGLTRGQPSKHCASVLEGLHNPIRKRCNVRVHVVLDRYAAILQNIQPVLSVSGYDEDNGDAHCSSRAHFNADLEANENTRRLFNQAFFSKIYIDEDDETRERTVRVDYNQPFDDLLNRLVPARVHHSLQSTNPDERQNARQENLAGASSFSISVTKGQGCPPSTLVGDEGLEPPTLSV